MRRVAGFLAGGLLAVALVAGCNQRDSKADEVAARLVASAGADRAAVHDLMAGRGLPAGVSSDDVLGKLLLRHWDDRGAAVGTMFAWIEGDARSSDTAAATRAGETASGLARYLAGHATELLNIDGPRTSSVGEASPLAVQGISAALRPYIPALAGGGPGLATVPAFTGPDAGDPARRGAQGIFSVVVSERDSAVRFVDAALDAAESVADVWVRNILDGRPADGLTATYGSIRGLAARGLELEAADRAAGKTQPQPYVDFGAVADIRPYYDLTHGLVTYAGVLDHDPRYDYLFTPDGALKEPAEIKAVRPDLVAVDSDLTNIVNGYRGGIMIRPADNFRREFREAEKRIA